MENGQACFNGTQDDSKYKTPVPVIGLYIAGATLVCLLLIVCDLVRAFRSRKLWVPCRFFTLNSFTLTVVGVVTKIPVDLTTPMPNGHDQLAKLCGTILLFLFMVLFLPSVGNMKASERLPNLASLTLIVITVIVNICLQIGTGLISKFVVEHVVLFVLMLLTLSVMWSSNMDVDAWSSNMIDLTKDFIRDGKSCGDGTIREGMAFSVCSSMNDPELVRCKLAHYPTIGILCAVGLVVLSEATFRVLHQKTSTSFFGQSASDYKWSMWVVVVTQIITILVGGMSIGLKSLVMASQMKPFVSEVKHLDFISYQQLRSFMPLFQSYYLPKSLSRLYISEISQVLQNLVSFWQFIIDIGMDWTNQVLIFLVVQIGIILGIFKREKYERFVLDRRLFPICDKIFDSWLVRQTRKNTVQVIEEERISDPQSSHLIQLLSRYPSPITSFTQQLDPRHRIDEFHLVTVLVRLTDAVLPSNLTRHLVGTFDEVFDVLYFIRENMVMGSYNNDGTVWYNDDSTMWMARDYWMCRKSRSHYFQRDFIQRVKRFKKRFNNDVGLVLINLGRAGRSIRLREVARIVDLVGVQEKEPLDALYRRIEELFVCLLHRFLNRLPDIIFKYMVESPPPDFPRRAMLCLKFLCRLNLVDSDVLFSETNIVSFITRETIGVAGQTFMETLTDDFTTLLAARMAARMHAHMAANPSEFPVTMRRPILRDYLF